MKILLVNCVYRQGSTGKIVYDLCKEIIENGMDSIVCYGRGSASHEPGTKKICTELYAKWNNLLSRISGVKYGGCLLSTTALIQYIKKEKPDVVHLHCINGYFVNIYRLICWLKKQHIKTILTLHAEFMHTANCSHAFACEKWKTGCGKCARLKEATGSILFDRTHRSWEKMRKAFFGFKELTVTSVSPWLKKRAELSPILKDCKHTVVLNGVDTEIFFPRGCCEDLRSALGLQGKKVVFHVTADFSPELGHNKGGHYILKLAERMKSENVMFLIAAGRCADGTEFPDNVIFLGTIADQRRLAEYYSLSDVTLITSQRETFSMPVAESLCCGTPVIGFKAGAPEEIALDEASLFVPYGDVDALEQAILTMLDHKNDRIGILAAAKFDKKRICAQYIDLYK